MTEQAARTQQTEPTSLADTLDAPLLYLSSRQAGWDGLVAEAYHEPTQLQGWMPQPTPDTALILFAGGSLHVDRYFQHGSTKTVVMHEGELVLRPGAGAPSEVSWKSLSPTPTRTLHLYLSRDLLSRTACQLADCDPARLSLPRRERFQDPLLRQIGFALWRELEQCAPAGKLYAQTAAQLLAVHLLRHYTSTQIRIKDVSQTLSRRQLQRVTDYVLADLRQDLSLEALADQTGLSPYHFARLFRRTTGESPHQFVLRRRVEKAQFLLRKTNVPLAEVALESGFANQSHLTRIFKDRLGLTPKAYRQKV